MEPFTHPHADSARVKFVKAALGSGFVSDTLVVTANIPFDPTHPSYDAGRVSDLEDSAVIYAKRKGIPHIEILSFT